MSVPPILLYGVIPGLWIIAILFVARRALSRSRGTEGEGLGLGETGLDVPAVSEPKYPVTFIAAVAVAVLYSAFGASIAIAILRGEDPLAALGLIMTIPLLLLAGLASLVDVLVSARRPHTARYRRLQWVGLLLVMLLFPVWYGISVLVT